MRIRPTDISGVFVVETTTHIDERGAFARLFCHEELSLILDERQVVQVNHSRTNMVGAVRGFHYQTPPHAEMKLVRCLAGRVWDVAVDLRQGSPSFLGWTHVELSPDNALMLMIPEGCAHGFQVLEPNSALLYMHTAFYQPSSEGGIRYDDPAIRIDWPLPVTQVSERDRRQPRLGDNFLGVAM